MSPDLAWLSGYSVSETMYRAVFVPREGAPWFVLRHLDADPCRQGGWIKDIVGYPDTANAEHVMAGELQRRGFSKGNIGVDFSSISWNPARMAAFAGLLPSVEFTNLEGVSFVSGT